MQKWMGLFHVIIEHIQSYIRCKKGNQTSLQEQNNNTNFGSEGLAVRLVPLELKRYCKFASNHS